MTESSSSLHQQIMNLPCKPPALANGRVGRDRESAIAAWMMLPNPISRFCTIDLKIRPMARHLKHLGMVDTVSEGEYFAWVGIRADEPRRVAKVTRDRAPLAAAGVTAQEVGLFWRAQTFDLKLPNMNGKTMHGNCTRCFLKPAAQILSLEQERHDPWWAAQEAWADSIMPAYRVIPVYSEADGEEDVQVGTRTVPNTARRFRLDRPSYAEMAKFAADQRDMFDLDEEAISCFCGD